MGTPTPHSLTAALAGLVLAASACGQSQDTGAQDSRGSSAQASTEHSTSSDPDADGTAGSGMPSRADLDFRATTVQGEEFSGEQLAGEPAVLWFWAPWCPTCRAQASTVSEIATRYGSEVAVVGVGGAAEVSEIKAVAESIKGPTHLIDEPGAVWRHFGVTAQSTYVILDAEGRIVTDGEFLSDDALREKVAEVAG